MKFVGSLLVVLLASAAWATPSLMPQERSDAPLVTMVPNPVGTPDPFSLRLLRVGIMTAAGLALWSAVIFAPQYLCGQTPTYGCPMAVAGQVLLTPAIPFFMWALQVALKGDASALAVLGAGGIGAFLGLPLGLSLAVAPTGAMVATGVSGAVAVLATAIMLEVFSRKVVPEGQALVPAVVGASGPRGLGLTF